MHTMSYHAQNCRGTVGKLVPRSRPAGAFQQIMQKIHQTLLTKLNKPLFNLLKAQNIKMAPHFHQHGRNFSLKTTLILKTC